ncbi:MAG: metal ABC transporter permease [Chloroflexi bacterium]|nr:metal ABC transporter permease [Chloroflexota bacterium]
MFQYDFLRQALIAGTLVAVTAGVVGYFLVLRQSTFAGHALAHLGFTGATGAALIGANVVGGMVLFTLAAALVMGLLGDRLRGRDVAIGSVLAFSMGLGNLFLSQSTRLTSRATSVLFGDLLAISADATLVVLACSVFVLLAIALAYRPLLFASIDPVIAETRGVPVRLFGVGFLLLLALAVTTATLVVGVLLIFALLVTPAATAQRLTARPGAAIALSVLFAVSSVWTGLLLALLVPWPPSFFITALSFGIYLLVTVGLPAGQRRRRSRLLPASLPATDTPTRPEVVKQPR